jgi:hypothetical protein
MQYSQAQTWKSLDIHFHPDRRNFAQLIHAQAADFSEALQATLNRWHAKLGKKIDRATPRHITPMGFERINFNGVLIFPLDRLRNRLMPSNELSARPVSARG